jgi:hypothetical protein
MVGGRRSGLRDSGCRLMVSDDIRLIYTINMIFPRTVHRRSVAAYPSGRCLASALFF